MVDGSPTATGMTVGPAEGNAWTVNWDTSGDTSDVAGWKVCTDYNGTGWLYANNRLC